MNQCFGLMRMAKTMQRKPMKVMAGPITMRRVEKMSGLKPFSTELPGPAMRMNPITMRARHTAIAI